MTGRARLALLALAASVLVPLVAAGLRSALWVLVGIAGAALAAVGAWWALAHTGAVRLVGAALCVAAPLAVLVLYATHDLLLPALVSVALWALAMAAARSALAPGDGPATAAGQPAPAPHRPWILMNPRSGGGKVGRFHLAERARAAGAEVVLLGADGIGTDGIGTDDIGADARDPGHRGGPAPHEDVAALASRAVADGADLLAVAGGDGTQALVAEVAARHDLPFLVIPAGTRNHFALDLGLDRRDPGAALEALSDGVELRVDLGFAADRVFVNNASFGTYAAVVADPAYRDEKARTTLQTLPALLTGPDAPRLRMLVDGTRVEGLQALLISNNPYLRAVDAARPGRRAHLDSGRLGVIGIRVDSAAGAAALVGGDRAGGLLRHTAARVVVEPEGAPGTPAEPTTLPVGMDGEHVLLPAPVECRIAPGALRVRVPRHRPGRPVRGGSADWPRVARLALGRRRTDDTPT